MTRRPLPSRTSKMSFARRDRDLLADQGGELCQRAAMLAPEGREQRLLLGRRSPVVDIADDAEIALQRIAGNEGGHAHDEARDVDALDLALDDAIGQRAPAGAVVGILADPAGAEDVAIADLQQVAFEPISHGPILPQTVPTPLEAARLRCDIGAAPRDRAGDRRFRHFGGRSPGAGVK